MAGNISSAYNSISRMTGLSGIDVDGMVSQLMQVEKAKVDAVSQNRQVVLWKQDQYREITSALQSLNDEYFNSLKSAQDMRNSAIYNAFAVKYDDTDTSSYFSAVAGGGVRTGDYTIKDIKTALTAKITGTAAAGAITGSSLTPAAITAISGGLDNNRFYAEFNGVKKEIILDDTVTDITGLADDLQKKLDAAFGTGKINVGINVDKLTFATDGTNTFKMTNTTNGGYAAIFNKDLSAGITPAGNNSRFKITLGTETKEFSLNPDTRYDNTDAVVAAIQGMVDDTTAGFGPGKIIVKNVNNKVVLESADSAVAVQAASAESGGLTALGFAGMNTSNKINLDAHIYDIRNSFAQPVSLTKDANDNDINFSINDQNFSFNSSNTSINDIISQVNSNTAAGVRMSYDSLNNGFILETKATGATASIKASDASSGFLGALSLTTAGTTGSDASITINDGVNGDQVITRSTNNFTVNGITFTLKKQYAGSVNLSINSDPTKAVELIKGFVSKYNEVLDKINTKLSEDRYYDYAPLTDTQKGSMSDDQIKQWEDKAKSGLLAGDDLLRSIATGMRNAMLDSVGGTTLTSIGIKSSSWTDKGKLYVDEDKLKNALAENPDQVFSLFTRQSDKTYYQAASDPTAKSERYGKNGLIYKLSDLIQDNIRTNTINDRRGALLEKAGAVGDRSQYSNTLYSQITEYDKRITDLNDELTAKENSYYDQFSKLETLINQMNSQSSWLSQQFA